MAGADRIYGSGGDDRGYGGADADVLRGDAGSDILYGGHGNDYLRGGAGADVLSGGGGADRFHFVSLDESRAAEADTIQDFRPAEGDRIDLRSIDADSAVAGDQAFTWSGAARFVGRRGQLRAEDDRIEADLDGDRQADLVIVLIGSPAVTPDAMLL